MKPLIERLEDEILVCDGAMGTQLLERGMPVGECPELWGITHPKILAQIHDDYISSGADLIITNTFGANTIKLSKFKLEKELIKINAESIKIAKQASKNSAYILADIGPTGEYIEPAGDLKFDDCYNAFLEQARILESEGADAVIIETMTDIEELKAAVLAVKKNTKLPLIVSMAFSCTAQNQYRTTSGVTIPQFVDEALMTGADAIGANCGVEIKEMTGIIKEMKPLSTAFILAQPNAGQPVFENNKTVYKQSVNEFAELVPGLIDAGANIIGGCCGTTPKHIKKIKKALKAHKKINK